LRASGFGVVTGSLFSGEKRNPGGWKINVESYDLGMTRSGREILERALKLAPAERLKIAHEIIESVPVDDDLEDDGAELSAEWRGEIERRLAEEPAPGNPWPTGEEVMARLRGELKKGRARKKRRGS
jgi:putative addiction module component (TIGR02574 family)